jgi:perosamine synthetase
VKKYAGNELRYLKKVLNGEGGPHGSWVTSLEQEFLKIFPGKYAIAMNSGTGTLHSALEAVGVGYKDEVITPALTVFMDTTSILHANAIPVYVDIDLETFNISPSEVEKAITKKTKAIIAVSLYGLPHNISELDKISRKYNIPIIEDHAQTMLAKYNGKTVSVSKGLSSWSFESTKHLSSGEGGILVTNNAKYAEIARKVGGQGYKNLSPSGGMIKFGKSENVQNPKYKRHDTLGWNYRMNEFTAAVALAQLEQLEEKVIKRVSIANRLLEIIGNSEILTPQKIPKKYTHSYYTLGCLLNDKFNWKEFRSKFIEYGGEGFYSAWSVPFNEPAYNEITFKNRFAKDFIKSMKIQKGFKNAEYLQNHLVQFKTNFLVKKDILQQERALKKTLYYFSQN